MTVNGLQWILLGFALAGFAGAGAALAVSRHRWVEEGARDAGLVGIATIFALFASLCTLAATSAMGVLAFGGAATWASYLLTAQRLGLFSIEARPSPPPEREPSEQHRR